MMAQRTEAIRANRNREGEGGQTNIVAPDQRVVSNSSTTVVQSETITPSYSGYSMISTESDYG